MFMSVQSAYAVFVVEHLNQQWILPTLLYLLFLPHFYLPVSLSALRCPLYSLVGLPPSGTAGVFCMSCLYFFDHCCITPV